LLVRSLAFDRRLAALRPTARCSSSGDEMYTGCGTRGTSEGQIWIVFVFVRGVPRFARRLARLLRPACNAANSCRFACVEGNCVNSATPFRRRSPSLRQPIFCFTNESTSRKCLRCAGVANQIKMYLDTN
jgi:hypothetical protein